MSKSVQPILFVTKDWYNTLLNSYLDDADYSFQAVRKWYLSKCGLTFNLEKVKLVYGAKKADEYNKPPTNSHFVDIYKELHDLKYIDIFAPDKIWFVQVLSMKEEFTPTGTYSDEPWNNWTNAGVGQCMTTPAYTRAMLNINNSMPKWNSKGNYVYQAIGSVAHELGHVCNLGDYVGEEEYKSLMGNWWEWPECGFTKEQKKKLNKDFLTVGRLEFFFQSFGIKI